MNFRCAIEGSDQSLTQGYRSLYTLKICCKTMIKMDLLLDPAMPLVLRYRGFKGLNPAIPLVLRYRGFKGLDTDVPLVIWYHGFKGFSNQIWTPFLKS